MIDLSIFVTAIVWFIIGFIYALIRIRVTKADVVLGDADEVKFSLGKFCIATKKIEKLSESK